MLGKKTDENIIREIEEFNGDYLPLDKDRLVLFAVNFLETKNVEPTFDKIVATAFKLFPNKFSLIGFPEYPDSNVIRECVHLHCTKSKHWLNGNLRSAYKVTDKGTYFLDETKKMLDGKIKITKTHSVTPKRKETTFINLLKKSSAYKKYLNKQNISDIEIFEALNVPTASHEVLKLKIDKFIEYSKRIDEDSATEFLLFLKNRLGGE